MADFSLGGRMPRVLVPICFMLLLMRVLHCQRSGLKTWRAITWAGLIPRGSSTRKGVCRVCACRAGGCAGACVGGGGGAPEFETPSRCQTPMCFCVGAAECKRGRDGVCDFSRLL